jgi:hypothetical protein
MHPTEATIASRYAAARAPTPAHHRSWQPRAGMGCRAMPRLLPPSRLGAVETPAVHTRQPASLAKIAAPHVTPSKSWNLGRLFPRVQLKLAIGPANDPLEHEADRVADRIMRMPGTAAMGNNASASQYVVQRTCASCDQRNEMMAATTATATTASAVVILMSRSVTGPVPRANRRRSHWPTTLIRIPHQHASTRSLSLM